jgi:hypothetical protein
MLQGQWKLNIIKAINRGYTMRVALEKHTRGIEHFKQSMPDAVALKMKALAELVEQDYISEQGEAYGCTHSNEVSGVGYAGFMPFQDGGYEVTELYRNDQDSSYHFNDAQTEWVDNQTTRMYEAFAWDNRKELVNAGVTLPEGWGYNDLPEDLQNVFSDYENEWFEPALLRFTTWAYVDAKWGNPATSVMMRVSLGYKDAPYYREKYDEDLKEITLSFEDFLVTDNETLANQLFKL